MIHYTPFRSHQFLSMEHARIEGPVFFNFGDQVLQFLVIYHLEIDEIELCEVGIVHHRITTFFVILNNFGLFPKDLHQVGTMISSVHASQ